MVHGHLYLCTHFLLGYFRCIILPLDLKVVDELVMSHFLSSSFFHWKAGMIGYPCETLGQDKDIGGAGNYYVIFVENLEKDLSPTSITDFIQNEVAVTCQAFVSRSLSSELFTRGNILLHSKKNFEKLCNFLENPDQIITSSRGRYVLVDALLFHFLSFCLQKITVNFGLLVLFVRILYIQEFSFGNNISIDPVVIYARLSHTLDK